MTTKREVYEKYFGQCAYCGRGSDLHIHHKEHKAMGGRKNEEFTRIESIDNLVLLCYVCHAACHGERAVLGDGWCCDICPGKWACDKKQLSREAREIHNILEAIDG